MKIAAAYIRVSTDDQLEYSPDSQLKLIRDYANKNDIILPDEFIFIDEGISGRNTKKRNEFNRMIGNAKQKPKPFDVILLWKFSRFARNRQDSIIYKTMLRKQLGIEVVSISESLGDDKTSILIEALIEAMDEYYSINLAEEVKRGMTEKAKRGEPMTVPAFGYEIKDKNYIINKDEAVIVKMIFNDFLDGLGFRELATKMNGMKILTHRGNKFENRTIEYILNNPVYIGKIRWNPSGRTHRGDYNNKNIMVVDGSHQPIIEEKIWSSVQQKLVAKKNQYKKYSREKIPIKPFMLWGLVKCNNCGSTLVNSSTGSLQCHLYAKGVCEESHSITIKKLNEAVLGSLEKIFRNSNFDINIRSKNDNSYDDQIKKSQLEKEYLKLERVKQAYENGIDTIEEYKTNKKRINETIKILKSEKTEPKASPEKLKKEFIQKHKNIFKFINDPLISEKEKNELLKSFIDKIIFDRNSNNVKIFLYI